MKKVYKILGNAFFSAGILIGFFAVSLGVQRSLGANDYITKPFGTNELLARVRAALRTRVTSFHFGSDFGCGIQCGSDSVTVWNHRF